MRRTIVHLRLRCAAIQLGSEAAVVHARIRGSAQRRWRAGLQVDLTTAAEQGARGVWYSASSSLHSSLRPSAALDTRAAAASKPLHATVVDAPRPPPRRRARTKVAGSMRVRSAMACVSDIYTHASRSSRRACADLAPRVVVRTRPGRARRLHAPIGPTREPSRYRCTRHNAVLAGRARMTPSTLRWC